MRPFASKTSPVASWSSNSASPSPCTHAMALACSGTLVKWNNRPSRPSVFSTPSSGAELEGLPSELGPAEEFCARRNLLRQDYFSSDARLNRSHIVVGQAEMMPDLVHQHVSYYCSQGLLVLGPVVENRTAIEPDHV